MPTVRMTPTARHRDADGPPPLWLLALVTLVGSLSMHIFVPALPAVAMSLHTGHAVVQATLTAYVLGLGAGQLLHGPLSDRLGRRPVLIAGMLVYVAASLVAFAAPSVAVLIAARLFQAVGAAAGVVLGRAIVRDSFGGDRAASMLLLLNLMVMIAPGIAPLIGGTLAAVAGWRAIFVVLGALGLFNLLTTSVLLRETVSGTHRGFREVVADYGYLLGSRAFVGWAVAGGCASATLYGFIGASPFIFVHQLHRPVGEVGIYLAFNIAGMAVGTLSARALIGRTTPVRIVALGNGLSAAGAVLFVGFAWLGAATLATVLATMLLFTVGAGLLAPIAMAQALAVNPHAAGSASGLYGCTQMTVGAICTSLAGIGASPMLAAGLVMLEGAALAQVCIRVALQGETSGASPTRIAEEPPIPAAAPTSVRSTSYPSVPAGDLR